MSERDVAEWLLSNESSLKEIIRHLYRPSYHLFPPAMHEIYLQQYQQGVLAIVRHEMSSLMNGEELLTLLTLSLIRKVTPNLLEQPKE